MRMHLALVLFVVSSTIQAQGPAWHQNPPNAGYWQQDVAYKIDATLNDDLEQINGKLNLVYTNNSPDDLSAVYFHLYQNMFDSNSYAEQMRGMQSKKNASSNGIVVSALKIDGKALSFEVDNTILRVDLKKPIKTGESVSIDVDFITQFGRKSGRMKSYQQFGYKHFNVVHWYPRISVYDRKFGWTTDQHVGHEFYGDFGSFEVNITLPSHYILDGTGVLSNRVEMLPETLMQKLDISNFSDKPWNEKPSEILPIEGSTKTWKFRANNVHDFAWTADPTYRIGRAEATLPSGNTVDCYSLAQEQHAAGWQNAAEYAARIIEVYSQDFGEYAYPKMIVADARDGMEYPMLTLDGGRDPYYRDLLAHEIGHNWFYGMVGNNETYRAALDEGFTQFLTSWCMERLEGDTLFWDAFQTGRLSSPQQRTTRDAQVYQGYYSSVIARDDSPALNTHSDRFENRSQYGQVYYKTAVMLYNLQYVLGDSLFSESIKHYFNQWKFCHPYFEDFRTSIIQFSGVDLNWFFDQWLEHEDKLDYAISSFKKRGKDSYQITIERKGEMEMPLDITLEDNNGVEYEYHIPISDFVKKTNAVVLDKWVGWNEFNTTYIAEIAGIEKVRTVRIDASNRLADAYQLDNQLPMPIEVTLDNLNYSRPFQAYQIEWHPSLWYNAFDGLKAGFETKGSYYNTYHNFDFGMWFSTGIGQQTGGLEYSNLQDDFYRVQYRIAYDTPLRSICRDLDFFWESAFIDGLFKNALGWRKQLSNKKTTITHRVGGLYRPSRASLNYLIYPSQWQADRWNNFSDLEIEHKYRYGNQSRGHVTASVRSPFLGSDYNYGYLNLEAKNDNRVWKLNCRTRYFAQFGVGSDWAPESQLFAAGANPEEFQENAFIRSAGAVPAGSQSIGTTTGWFQSGGGLNLRGYNNYLLPETNDNGLLTYAFAGNTGTSFSTELEFDDILKPAPRLKRWIDLNTYLFADAGLINTNDPGETLEFSSLRADAGAGIALNVNQWGNWKDLGKTTIRADFPIWLNRPPASQEFVEFRWLLAIDRAF